MSCFFIILTSTNPDQQLGYSVSYYSVIADHTYGRRRLNLLGRLRIVIYGQYIKEVFHIIKLIHTAMRVATL